MHQGLCGILDRTTIKSPMGACSHVLLNIIIIWTLNTLCFVLPAVLRYLENYKSFGNLDTMDDLFHNRSTPAGDNYAGNVCDTLTTIQLKVRSEEVRQFLSEN